MALGQPICLEAKNSAERRDDYIVTETYIIGFLYACRKHITISPYDHTHAITHVHKLTHHHPSITLILPLSFLLFYAQSKSGEVVNMWGYLTPPSLSYFLFPSCFSMLSLSLEKLLTCGVISPLHHSHTSSSLIAFLCSV